MKKSKLLVPALGILSISTVASITGTVAWFTASRTATVNAGDFAVVKTNADLNYVLGAGHGTFVVSDAISLTNEGGSIVNTMTDASFNHIITEGAAPNDNDETYYIPNDAGSAIDHKITMAAATNDTNATTGLIRQSYVDNNGTAGDPSDDITRNVYSAVVFTITFKVSFGSVPGNYALMMDHTAGHSKVQYWNGSAYADFAAVDGSESKQGMTSRGFRMAFISDDATRVWADGQRAADCKHSKNAAAATATNAAAVNTAYVSPALQDQTVGTTLPDDNSATATCSARSDYLGKITFSAGTIVDKTVTVVAWYEGSDPYIINQESASGYQKVKAEMHFALVALSD